MPEPSAHRCPYCHEDVAARAADRATCLLCGADHHAECFAENRGCAATACRHPQASLWGRALDHEAVGALAAQPGALERARASALGGQGLFARWVAALGLALGGALLFVAIASTLSERPQILLDAALAGACVGLGLSAFLFRRQAEEDLPLRAPREPELHFDPIFGTWTRRFLPGLPPSGPGDELARSVGRAAPPNHPLPGGEGPTACPDCSGSLEPEEPLAFCYHCGGSLVDPQGRWRKVVA